MRIAWVNSTRKWGGVKTWYLTFARELKRLGHTNFVWARPGVFLDRCREDLGHGSSVNFGPDYNPLAIAYFVAAFARMRIDILIVNVGKDLTTAGIAARILGIPVVQRIGLPQDIALKDRTRKLHQWIRPSFLCPCEYIARGFRKALPYVESKDVSVILNGKNPTNSEIKPSSKRELIMTSQLISSKCHDVVLEAAKEVEGDFRLNIVGTGDLDDELKRKAEELGLKEKVVFSGFTSDVSSALAQADIFVLSSVSEGLPNTLLEAFASGLLPVSRKVGGVSEVWPEEFDDFLVAPGGGVEEFRLALQKAISLSDSELVTYKRKAREACASSFSLRRQSAQLETWLASLIH